MRNITQQNIQTGISSIINENKKPQILITGDFNYNFDINENSKIWHNELESLKKFFTFESLNCTHNFKGDKKKSTKIDWLGGLNLKIENIDEIDPGFIECDHKGIVATIVLDQECTRQEYIVPNIEGTRLILDHIIKNYEKPNIKDISKVAKLLGINYEKTITPGKNLPKEALEWSKQQELAFEQSANPKEFKKKTKDLFGKKFKKIAYNKDIRKKFIDMKALTSFNKFDKKEGSIMNSMKNENGDITNGDTMNKLIKKHLINVSGSNDSPIENISVLNKKDINIEEMIKAFKKRKAETADGVSYDWFILHTVCKNKDPNLRCQTCKKKIEFMLSCFDQDYWNLDESKRHLYT